MGKKYLITGGLGFIGKAITLSLLSKNNTVIIADNNFRKKKNDLKHKNLYVHKIDVRKKNQLIKISKDIDSVIHLAFINGTNYFYEKPELVLEVGIKGIINLIEVCKENFIKEFFLASSSEVYQNAPYIPTNEKVPLSIPDPHNPRYSYAAGKLISEIMLLNSSIFERLLIFRPHNIYGPNMGYNHVIPEIILKIFKSNQKINIQGKGLNSRSFCYIDDFVSAFNLILKKGKHKNIYNIGTQEEIRIRDLVKRIISISEKKLHIQNTKEILGNVKRRCPDILKLKKLGFKPKNNLNIGLAKTFEWYSKDIKGEL
ncbi:uncharacterized protein METZ01_LOCUS90571 [marine metagenome]|uniref:NAD-dependent epimerase/dehydratase domain-containing protein n=1 Tax=marine metagenome TaxID=408172 RepID=A0A381VDJ4_9ZZZZ